MRHFVLLLTLSAMVARAAEGDVPPPPPPPPPPSSEPVADQPPPPPSSTSPEEAARPRTNWAKPAAFIGFGVGGAVLLLGLVGYVLGNDNHDDYYSNDFTAGRGAMLLAAGLTAAGGPIVYAGGRSARWTKSISGSTALRIVGWISYGVALLAQLTSLWVTDLRGWGGLLGAGSMTCFGIDALLSAGEAADVAEVSDADDGFRFGPTVSLLRALPGHSGGGAVVGLRGAF
ncbi:MAG: hypothetical protein IPJ65_38845 [Archangiaceae bacterium]|nr:hypothetical protein [Archangiaceae bacterium]